MPGKFQLWAFHCLLPQLQWSQSLSVPLSVCNRGSSSLLFLAGNVQAVALRDIFTQARNRDNFPAMLQQEEPEWEKRRSVNLSELIDIYR